MIAEAKVNIHIVQSIVFFIYSYFKIFCRFTILSNTINNLIFLELTEECNGVKSGEFVGHINYTTLHYTLLNIEEMLNIFLHGTKIREMIYYLE